ncbi:5-formyltetrahydrofolate cyclo-ligase [Paucibacter sp. M5-1]|uniref:5-formyltetrahydrofolate cyclo-ligase n=1 Tax=Paucibacter sp. M5-1 TaxID=3015998 RepID=UPI0022B87519|nr:5-formyltetrahydrofolate cyclo-ligase [Paucibacter sp. M5-1]MCZ7880138.1 5-formyltetrahydrofolate cyclo-ligase [Paucibacter sp. M5-1]
MSQTSTVPHERAALRTHLLAARAQWLASTPGQAAAAALAQRLRELLEQLEPQCLGLYWPLDGEFNAVSDLLAHALPEPPVLALPYAYKASRRMDYRRWDGSPPALQDECGIASCAGAPVQPDVVLVPCVGFTREGYRLGYGGGYFDRWLAAHPGVTSVGLAWSCGEASFAVEPHDQALTLVLTEHEVISP